MINKSIISIDNTYKDKKNKHKDQILEIHWKKRKKEYKRISQNFANLIS